jgi:hypothetical protein
MILKPLRAGYLNSDLGMGGLRNRLIGVLGGDGLLYLDTLSRRHCPS